MYHNSIIQIKCKSGWTQNFQTPNYYIPTLSVTKMCFFIIYVPTGYQNKKCIEIQTQISDIYLPIGNIHLTDTMFLDQLNFWLALNIRKYFRFNHSLFNFLRSRDPFLCVWLWFNFVIASIDLRLFICLNLP